MSEVLIALISVLIAGLLGYWGNSLLSLREKRRELALKYLIDAYTVMESVAHKEINSELENALGIIQLFGTIKQIELAKKLALDIANNGEANFDELLLDLRNNLRTTLGLEEYKNRIIHLRIAPNKRTK